MESQIDLAGLALAAAQTSDPARSGDAPPWLVFAIIGAFLVVFPLFWCTVVWMLSRASGWGRLADRYSTPDEPRGQRISGVRGMLGGVGYNGVLTLHLDDAGFFLGVMLLFRVGHRRLFIPYADIAERKTRKILWRTSERFVIGRPKIATLTLPDGLLPPGMPPGSG